MILIWSYMPHSDVTKVLADINDPCFAKVFALVDFHGEMQDC